MRISGPDRSCTFGDPPILFLRFTVDGAEAWVQALPTIRYQFEAFLAEAEGFDNAWYELSQVLPTRESPIPWRVAPQAVGAADYEAAFVGGLWPSEAMGFCGFVDGRAALPTLELWRGLYDYARTQPAEPARLETPVSPLHDALAASLLRHTRPRTLAQAMLLENGLLEWAEVPTWQGPTWRLIGRPRQALYPCAFSPVKDPIEPQPGARVRPATVRLVVHG